MNSLAPSFGDCLSPNIRDFIEESNLNPSSSIEEFELSIKYQNKNKETVIWNEKKITYLHDLATYGCFENLHEKWEDIAFIINSEFSTHYSASECVQVNTMKDALLKSQNKSIEQISLAKTKVIRCFINIIDSLFSQMPEYSNHESIGVSWDHMISSLDWSQVKSEFNIQMNQRYSTEDCRKLATQIFNELDGTRNYLLTCKPNQRSEKRYWNEYQVAYLCQLISQSMTKLNNWKMIAAKINEKFNANFSPRQCFDKWKKVKKNLDSVNQTI